MVARARCTTGEGGAFWTLTEQVNMSLQLESKATDVRTLLIHISS